MKGEKQATSAPGVPVSPEPAHGPNMPNPQRHTDVHANEETTMKPQIHPCIAMITLIAVFATAGCLGPADTAVNATPEPTLEPCETCTAPWDNSSQYEKLDPELADRVATMRSDEKIVIWIWLTEPSGTTYAAHEAPVIDFLEEQNATMVYASQYAPVVFAEVSLETIQDLCKRPDVVSLDISREYEPALPQSRS